MLAKKLSLILYIVIIVLISGYEWATLSKQDHFVKKPAEGILVGGRLTQRQIVSLSDAGFKSVLSIVNFTADEDSYNNINGDFLSSENERKLAESLGMSSKIYPTQLSQKDVDIVSETIFSMPKPVFVHCHVGWSASLFTTLYLYSAGFISPSSVVMKGFELGWNFLSNSDAVALINQVTGSNYSYSASPVIEFPLTGSEAAYKTYYWPHRMGNDYWYNMGQPLDTHVETIISSGYKTVVSLRNNGEPTLRLSTDPSVGPVSNNEFSDSNGNYVVDAEKSAFEAAGAFFINMPVTGDASWTDIDNFLTQFVPAMKAAESRGAVLIHCASGYRSAGYTATYLAYSQGKCTSWALQQAALVGFDFTKNAADQPVVDFMASILKC